MVEHGGFKPAVIFGQRIKLTAEATFLDLLRAFKQALSKLKVKAMACEIIYSQAIIPHKDLHAESLTAR